MAGQIPQSFIDQLLDQADLASIVSEDVTLKRSGGNYQGRCPFHDDRSPSFSVSNDKGVYHCFGCGASGNALTYIRERRGLDFVGALEDLAKRQGVEVPREDISPAQEKARALRDRLYTLSEEADKFFQRSLRVDSLRTQAVEYLQSRGLSGETAKKFGIGVAPASGQALREHLKGLGFSDSEMIDAGVLVDKNGRRYDRFRNRITFPIRDRRGRGVAFTARVLDDSKPKYLNSSESPIFSKSKVLYGLHEALISNRNLERLIVVEGQMDVIALAQFGLNHAVATSGTAVTKDHVEQLVRLVPQVVFCFDGDTAGRKAARKAMEIALPFFDGQTEFSFVFMPDGQDPDSLLKESGLEGYNKVLAQSQPLSRVLFDFAGEGLDMNRMDSRVRLGGLAAPLLKLVPKGLALELLLDELAKRIGTDKDSVRFLVQSAEAPSPTVIETPPEPDPEPVFETASEHDYPAHYDTGEDDYAYFEAMSAAPDNEPPNWDEPAAEKLTPPLPGQPLSLAADMLRSLRAKPALASKRIEWPYEGPMELAVNEVIDTILECDYRMPFDLIGHYSGTDIGRVFTAFERQENLMAPESLDGHWRDLQDRLDQVRTQQRQKSIKRQLSEIKQQSPTDVAQQGSSLNALFESLRKKTD